MPKTIKNGNRTNFSRKRTVASFAEISKPSPLNSAVKKLENGYDNLASKLNLTVTQKTILPYFTVGFVSVLAIFLGTMGIINTASPSQIALASCPTGYSAYGNGCISPFMQNAISNGYKGDIVDSTVNCFLVGLQTENGCNDTGIVKKECDSILNYSTNGQYFDPYDNIKLICD